MAGLHEQDGFLNSLKTLESIDACTSEHSDMVIQPNLQSGLLFLHHSGHSRHTHRNTPNGLKVMPIYTFISAISSSVKNCRSGLETRTMRGNQLAEGNVLELVWTTINMMRCLQSTGEWGADGAKER